MNEANVYTLQIAKPNDLGSIVDYYRSSERPVTVFQRTAKVIEKTIQQDLFFLLKDRKNNIAAAAAIYTHDAAITVSKGQQTRIDFAEFGSLWRRTEKPKGFIRELFYSAAIMHTLHQACTNNLSLLVTQVVATDKDTVRQLRGLNQGWAPFEPSSDFSNTFKQSIVDEESRRIELLSFIAPVNKAIISASDCLLGHHNSKINLARDKLGSITALDRTNDTPVVINMDSTKILQTAKAVAHAQKQAKGGIPIYNSWTFACREILPPYQRAIWTIQDSLRRAPFTP